MVPGRLRRFRAGRVERQWAAQAGYLRPEAVEALFAEHRSGTANHGRVLYAVAMFALWWEQIFANQPAAFDRAAVC